MRLWHRRTPPTADGKVAPPAVDISWELVTTFPNSMTWTLYEHGGIARNLDAEQSIALGTLLRDALRAEGYGAELTIVGSTRDVLP